LRARFASCRILVMKNITLKAVLTLFVTPLVFTLCVSAQSALEQAQGAASAPSRAFDGQSKGGSSLKADLPEVKGSESAVKGDEAPPEKKEGFLSKLGKDMKDNKMGYMTIVGMGALFGLLAFGTGGAALIGAGVVLLFTALTRMSFYGAI